MVAVFKLNLGKKCLGGKKRLTFLKITMTAFVMLDMLAKQCKN